MFKLQNRKLSASLLLSVATFLALALALVPKTPVFAANPVNLPIYFAQEGEGDGGGRKAALARDCNDKTLTKDNCGIVRYVVVFINVLSAVVGIIIVIMIVVGGIQYSASRDNPQATAAAKGRIVNAIIALLFFLFTFAFLQWVVPGGAFSS